MTWNIAATLPSALRAHVRGTFAIDLQSVAGPLHAQRIQEIKDTLTLTRRGMTQDDPGGPEPFWLEQEGWLHLPRGFLLTTEGAELLRGAQIEDGRRGGLPLPAGTRVTAALGVHPYPVGQPRFVDDLVAGCTHNGHGGLGIAPTRAGKTLCALAAACRLGGTTLVLVDRVPLMQQWIETVEAYVRDGEGKAVKVGVIQEDRFEAPPRYPISVAMTQTLCRRQLPDDFRDAYRTVILDECSSAPAQSVIPTLQRVAGSFVIGLSATPDRKDGLTRAISWIVGPKIAELKRDLEADVHFLHLPFKHAKVWRESSPDSGEMVERKPRLTRPNGSVNIISAEQSLVADPERVEKIAEEAVKAESVGRRVLIFVGLRDHVARLVQVFNARWNLKPGVFIGGQDDRAAMKRNVCITTFGMASKGIDFQPPFTLVILAGPRADIRQAVGRVLNPQAPHRPMILDVVDGHKTLIGLAKARARTYKEKGFFMRNSAWTGRE